MGNLHTPGPWFLGSDSDFIFDSNDENANTVCRFFNRDEHDYENKQANAKLIAAAPELLEACITLIQQAETCNYHTSDGLHALLDNLAISEIRKAIKKATE